MKSLKGLKAIIALLLQPACGRAVFCFLGLISIASLPEMVRGAGAVFGEKAIRKVVVTTLPLPYGQFAIS
jgi:hypothetical protein